MCCRLRSVLAEATRKWLTLMPRTRTACCSTLQRPPYSYTRLSGKTLIPHKAAVHGQQVPATLRSTATCMLVFTFDNISQSPTVQYSTLQSLCLLSRPVCGNSSLQLNRRIQVDIGCYARTTRTKNLCTTPAHPIPSWRTDEVPMGSTIQARCLSEVCACASSRRLHCLLYTSPSPRDRQKSRMPSSA